MAFIYALVDAEDKGYVRYVGKTARRVCDRLWDHRKYAKQKPNGTHRNAWINSVVNAGGSIEAIVLEECDEAVLNAREMFWVAHFRGRGFNLTNHTAGGDGSTNMDDATKQKLREFRTGSRLSEETKQKISRAFSGRPSPMTGKKHTADALEKMKGRGKGVPKSKDTRAKMAISRSAALGKLSAVDVVDIFQRCIAAMKPQSAIAKDYNISTSTVERIFAGKSWSHLCLVEKYKCS